jgi:DNA-binding LacI/PurR family transcriptional regulator/ABC-type glycerol-3-phosphate transport system substrate-binding protein
LAGVSHGTVSNVLNGYKSVNSDIVKRVEAAVKELGYQPNLKARSMRNSRTDCIGVLLPNITDNIYIRLYNGIERIASEANYNISLYISNGSPETEEILLLRMQQQRMDGAVVVTCTPGKTGTFDQLLKSGTRLVFVRRKPVNVRKKTFLGIDERQAVCTVTTRLVKSGCGEIALLTGREEYSNEKECIEGFRQALKACGRSANTGNVVQSIADGAESAFRAAAWLLYSKNRPRAIITTCPEHAKGVQAAVTMFMPEHRLLVLGLDNESWTNTASLCPIISIAQKYFQLGEEAAKKLLAMIETAGADTRAAASLILPAQPAPTILWPPEQRPGNIPRGGPASKAARGKTLRILMLENTSSVAGTLMKSVFTGETGIPVSIETLPYEAMYDATIGGCGTDRYDILQINIPWITEAIQKGVIIPLDELMEKNNVIRSAFSPEILARHGLFEGTLYTAPFLIGTQLLFYRKDLFSDLRIRRLYYEKNKTALEVPATWQDYDQVAGFFTRSLNPESPVLYGTTMGGPSGSYCCMPRLWEAGVSLFQEGPDDMKSAPGSFLKKLEDTLSRYVQAFEYADPRAINWDQADQAEQFCRGNAAMMVIFQAHFADHVYQYESSIYRENIGFAPLPNRASVLGGWSLGIRAGSAMRREGRCFLEWLFRDTNSIPYNILGGSIPSRIAFDSFEMRETYPWLSPVFDGVRDTRGMIDDGVHWISQWEFEYVLEAILDRLIRKKITAQDAAGALRKKLIEIKKRAVYTISH